MFYIEERNLCWQGLCTHTAQLKRPVRTTDSDRQNKSRACILEA